VTPLAAELADDVLERFLRYVRIDTQSAHGVDASPSTEKQLDLARLLRDELEQIGLEDVRLDEYGYVYGSLSGVESAPAIGLIAHVDTSPDVTATGVKPQVHEGYDGGVIALPGDPSVVLDPEELPLLKKKLGHDIVTTDGTTLLGADDKAGVAEIVAAAEYLMKHREIPHGAIRIGFTPDEEVGNGTKYFDVAKFGAACAYTMDGETKGEIEMETWSADALTISFQGNNTHPGYAKGKMINAIKVAADFVNRLPKDRLSPETTEGYDGFVHPYVVNASVEKTSVKLLLRDFKTARLREQEAFLTKLARDTVADWPGTTVEFKVDESYRNMKEVLDKHPQVVENAREAIRRTGLTLREHPIRGGTDGSRLCFMGLPTPNIFAGEHNFHSRLEWVSAQDMELAAKVIVELAKVWEERTGDG